MQRRRSSRFVVETPKLVREALDSNLAVDFVIVSGDTHPDREISQACEEQQVPLFGLAPADFAALSDVKTPQPALAVVEMPSLDPERLTPRLVGGIYLALVGVADPGNVGTLIRTAEAAGCAGVIVTAQTADAFSPKVVRSSAGSILRVPLLEATPDDLGELFSDLGAQVMATDTDGVDYRRVDVDLDLPVVIALGSEAHGLPRSVSELATCTVSIPMEGKVESLNVATVGAVLAFDMAARLRD